MNQMYTQEIISPILSRRRMHKQELWIQDIKEQILQAEVAKSQYKIRAELAESRIVHLGAGIQQAYAHTKNLFEERLNVEGEAIRNDALVSYLGDLYNADADGGASFQDSHREIRALMERFLWKTKCSADLDRAKEAVQHKQQLLQDLLRHAQELQTVIDNLKAAWIRLPAIAKENISHKAHTGTTMPPAAALQLMATSCQALITGQQQYSAVLAAALVMSGETRSLKM